MKNKIFNNIRQNRSQILDIRSPVKKIPRIPKQTSRFISCELTTTGLKKLEMSLFLAIFQAQKHGHCQGRVSLEGRDTSRLHGTLKPINASKFRSQHIKHDWCSTLCQIQTRSAVKAAMSKQIIRISKEVTFL